MPAGNNESISDREDSGMDLEEEDEDDFDAAESMTTLIRWLAQLRAHQRRNVRSTAQGNLIISYPGLKPRARIYK